MKEGYGEFIKRHRIASGFKSQRKLAEKTGISSATISRIESEIQKPEFETLKILAEYLETTTLVELMVRCGYWGEEDLLEDHDLSSQYLVVKSQKKHKENTSSSDRNEDDFISKINLSDDDLLKQFDLKIDGESLTEEEAKGIIAYVRSLRQMKS